MKRIRWFAAALALASLPALAPAQDDPKALFNARYAELTQAMQAKDVAAVAKVVTADYLMTDIRGDTHDAAGLVTLFERLSGGSAGGTQRKSEVLSTTFTGASAAVQNKVETHSTRVGPDGAPHQMALIVVSDDSWTLIDGTWRMKSSVQKDLTIMRDGEEFLHQAN
ncbi:DUF4440 domain-containing protein [Novosphingobium sp. B 225]|uniref:DUF4440 domain-containing protein n=1 Tax=Novosphingobium sp. B 225 TaxID=1961849 RepID=UPI001595E689|nr:DUF4440 domain-containing protein [Novosphingobium sp. B 225]